MPMAPLVIQQRTRTLLQVATSWPVDEGGWNIVDGWCEGYDDGFCNDVGAATITIPGGLVVLPTETETKLGVPVSITGKYIRISEEAEDGIISDTDGSKYNPVWWGVVVGEDFENDGEQHGLQISYSCAGILAIMDQVTPERHFGVPQSGDIAADIGTAAVFNSIGGKKTGNRSADLYDFGDGVTAHVFDNSGDGEEWTALDAANYVLALFHISSPGSPIITLAGQTTALGWTEKFDLGAMNSLEMLSRIMNPKQGVGFTRGAVTVDGIEIDVMSLSKDAIPSGSFTLPANPNQETLDATLAENISRPRVSQDQTSTYDVVTVEMDKAQFAMTLSLLDFEPDWTPAERAAMELLDEDDPLLETAPHNKVGRRFKLRADWDGISLGGFTMPADREVETSDLHGAGGYTGILVAGGEYVSKAQFRLLKDLPYTEGYDWSTQDPATADTTKKSVKPFVVAHDNTGVYSPLGDVCVPPLESIQIEVDEDTPAITLGPKSIVDTVMQLLDDNWDLLFTVGIEAQMETLVSYRRNPAEMPRGAPRIFKKERKGLKQRFITPLTVLGVDGVALKRSPNTLVEIQNDLPLAKSILAATRPWFTQPNWTVSCTWVGKTDRQIFPPGTMITKVRYLEGDASITELDIIGVVTKRSVKYSEPGELSITTKRIPVSVETVL